MRRILLSLLVALFAHHIISAQSFNSVYPIINSTAKGSPVFICASVSISYGETDIADEMGVYVGSKQCKYAEGSFISFKYVSREDATSSTKWGHGASAKQLAFYPCGVKKDHYTPYSPTGIPLYAFECSKGKGLRLIDLTDYSIVAVLDEEGDPKKYSNLTVFAGGTTEEKDIIVIAGNGKFIIFENIPESSGVRSVYSSNAEPSYFGINGQKYDAPQQGVNIIANGQETKKIIVK